MNLVFGPINSRRFGMSLGIDLSPNVKSCNFNCVYCELKGAKPTFSISEPPNVKDVVACVKGSLLKHKDIDVITITANGEPTLYPHLKELVQELKQIKTTQKLLILSNGTGVLDETKFDALMDIDIVKFSLDSATDEGLKKIDGCMDLTASVLIKKMADFRAKFKGELVLEVLVVNGFNDNIDEFNKLNEAINFINPNRVDIGTIDRPPAYNVSGVSYAKLKQLSNMIENVPTMITKQRASQKKYDFSGDEIVQMLSRRPQTTANI